MKVSFIVCTYNIDLLTDTLDCIQSLINQTFSHFEIILVMDHNDTLQGLLKKTIPESVKLVINTTPGLSSARNAGINHTNGEIIVFIDDDATAAPDFIKNLVKNYEDTAVIGAGGKIIPKGTPNYPEELYWIGGFTYKGHPEVKGAVRNVLGCNMSFRKEVFTTVGLFDVNFGRKGRKLVTAEETEFSLRVLNTYPQYRIVYDPSAIVYHKVHHYRENLKYLIRRCYHEGFSKASIKSSQKKHQNGNFLFVESFYLKSLFLAVYGRLLQSLMGKNIRSNITDCLKIVIAIIMVGMGFLTFELRKIWRGEYV